MAKYGSFDRGLVKPGADAGGLVLEELDVPEVGKSTAKGEFDFMGQLKEMSTRMQADTEESANGLAVTDGLGDIAAGLDHNKFTDVVGDQLREANELIEREQFEAALEVLSKLLAERPDCHQGVYLQALCHASLNNREEALGLLNALNDARLEGALGTKVQILRDRVRRELLFEIMIESVLHMQAGELGRTIERLRRVVRLDPTESMYRFMLSGNLMLDEQYPEALAAVDAAIAAAAGAGAELQQLRGEICKRYGRAVMKPALDALKAGRYGDARRVLRGLPADIHETPLCRIFDNYLKDLEGGFFSNLFGRRPKLSTVTPRGGTPEEIETFYFFLVGDSIRAARQLMDDDEYEGAETILLALVRGEASGFPYANYLAAVCVYARVMSQFSSGDAPDLDTTVADLAAALEMARVGTRDPDVKDSQDVVDAIAKILDALREAGRRREEAAREAKPVNDAIEEFNSIMEAAGDGVSSPEQFHSLKRRLEALVKRIRGMRGQVTSKQGREVLDQLDDAASRNLKQLESMADDVEEATTVKGCYEAFEAVMGRLQRLSQSSSRSEVIGLRDAVTTLRSHVKDSRRKVKSSDAREALDKLSEQLDQLYNMMNP